MPGLLNWQEGLLLLAVACGVVYHLLSAWCVGSYLRHAAAREQRPHDLPPVTILKPLRGAEPHAYDCFATFCRQDYPDFELVFGVLDGDDPAVAVVERLRQDFPAVPIRLVVSDRRVGANLKVCNLANMLAEARHPLLVLSDSDMQAAPDYLRHVAAGFADPGVGLVTCPYRGVRLTAVPPALEALGIATDFMPGVFVVGRLGKPDFAFGSTIALHRETLGRLGGFEAIADYLADDYQLGHQVADLGRRVHLSSQVTESVLGAQDLATVWRRRLRWARAIRVSRPGGHAASVITQSTFFAVALLLASGFSPLGWAVLALQQAVRAATAWWIAVPCLGNRELPRWFWLLPVNDLLNFALWLGSWLGRHVEWRGSRYRLTKGGRMEPV